MLELSFDEAIAMLESGNESGASRAADALTALRFELYDTPDGREHHARLEEQLESLTEVEQ
jgi:hypothetical protein